MIARLFSLLLLLYLLGFIIFAVTLGSPAKNQKVDAVIAITGGPERIEHAVDVLSHGYAKRMLIAGADPSVTKKDLIRRLNGKKKLVECCVDLGSESVDTRSNAEEADRWLAKHGYRSFRLVTSDWHMRRARYEFRRVLGRRYTVIPDAVRTQPSFRTSVRRVQQIPAPPAGGRRRPMTLVRSLLYALIFYPATAVLVLVGVIVTLFGTGATRGLVRFWTEFNHRLARLVLGIRSEVEGEIPAGAVLIAVKHESMYETLEMERLADTPVIVLKQSLSQIPLFGWLTRRYGVIPVDRSAGAKALREMVAAGRDAVSAGRAVIIYPEGTRVAHGRSPKLRPGFAGLYRALGLPVVPVAVDSGRLWTKGLLKKAGTVHFRIGETIPPGLKREEVEARVHAAINALNH